LNDLSEKGAAYWDDFYYGDDLERNAAGEITATYDQDWYDARALVKEVDANGLYADMKAAEALVDAKFEQYQTL
jgi:hypothetical protein